MQRGYLGCDANSMRITYLDEACIVGLFKEKIQSITWARFVRVVHFQREWTRCGETSFVQAVENHAYVF